MPLRKDSDECLLCDERYDGRYHIDTLEEANLDTCKNSCRANPSCLEFDFYLPQSYFGLGSCVLSKVDLATLKQRVPGDLVEVGSRPEDLHKKRATRCVPFHRVKREGTLPSWFV